MHCAACSAAVEKITRKLPGVTRCDVNLTTSRMSIDYDAALLKPDTIIGTLDKLGFGARPMSGTRDSKKEAQAALELAESQFRREKNSIIAAIILAALLLYVSMGSMLGAPLPTIADMSSHPVNFALIQLLLSSVIMLIGRRFYISGFRALINLHPNMDSLVAIGSAASFVYSLVVTFLLTDRPELVHSGLYYESAAVVVTLVSLGKHMEEASKHKTTGAIRGLMELTPETAVLIGAAGMTSEVPTELLRVGDSVRVAPGSRIPLDGVVTEGSGGVDESMLTGESLPVDKISGSEVTGGSICLNATLDVRITRVGDDTTLAAIIRTVEDAQGKKAPISKIADRVAGVFVPCVMAIALLAAVIWLLAGEPLPFALRVFTSVLVVACPCAMGLATPTAIVVGTGLGAKHGILIKSGEALETLRNANTVVLDKTGTVTEGKPRVTDVVVCGSQRDELLSVAAAVESASVHPLAAAVVEAANNEGCDRNDGVSGWEALPGLGVSAKLSDGSVALVGSRRLMDESAVDVSEITEDGDRLTAQGKTVMYVSLAGRALGLIAVADTVRDDSAEAIKKLHELNMRVILLTGDNSAAAKYIGDAIGADDIIAEVLPVDKADVIRRLQADGRSVVMVGDGINDAPALTAADVGCAIGAGSDIAIESADLVLMGDRLSAIPQALRLSRLTIRNIKQNLFWAFCYNTVGIPIAAGLLYPFTGLLFSPMLGALAMSLSSVCVVGNALRLGRHKL